MYFFERIAEDRIQAAIRNGEFDNLSNKGKPINLDYWLSLPVEIRAGLTLLKNSGFIPEEVQLLKNIGELREQLANCTDDYEKLSIQRKLEETKLRFSMISELKKRKK